MILLCGLPTESPLAMVREQLDRVSAPYLFFNQRQFATSQCEFEISAGRLTGRLEIDQQGCSLDEIHSVYVRLLDDQALPELQHDPESSPRRQHCRRLHDALIQWLDLTPARVVNRLAAMGSNASKPYQAQLIQSQGFKTPETLITNDPKMVEDFYRQHQRVIYKSVSSVRSIVQMMTDHDLTRLHQIRWCPTQFQAFVDGMNVRVHVIGTKVFATAVHCEVTDYRYAAQAGGSAELEAVDLADDLAERCVHLAGALGLAFAGIDLKVTPDDEVYCFEVNPSPGFSYYEHHTQQPIAQAVAQYLIDGDAADNRR
jgi:hypothetical protein